MKKLKKYLPDQFIFEKWNDIEPFLQELRDRLLNNSAEVRIWLHNKSELLTFLTDYYSELDLRFQKNSEDKDAERQQDWFLSEINPRLTDFLVQMEKKLLNCPSTVKIKDPSLNYLIRNIRNEHELYNKESETLYSKTIQVSREFDKIIGNLTVDWDGNTISLNKAVGYQSSADRDLRKQSFLKVNEKINENRAPLDTLFDRLFSLRKKITEKSGIESFQQYCYLQGNRLDYSIKHSLEFQDSVRKEIVPVFRELLKQKKQDLGYKELFPWDRTAEDLTFETPLFGNTEEFLNKAEACLSRIHTDYGKILLQMKKQDGFDLEPRPHKTLQNQMCPLFGKRTAVLIMNAEESISCLKTFFHEMGHVFHFNRTGKQELHEFRIPALEMDELASQTMELFCMDHWDIFFKDKEDLRKAQITMLTESLESLIHIAKVDKMEHLIYQSKTTDGQKRDEICEEVQNEFSTGEINWQGYEHFRKTGWLKFPGFYQRPFDLIAYAFGQIGALDLWRQYRESPEKTIEQFELALSLGGSRSVTEIYKTAGIPFDFSREKIATIAVFISKEIEKLNEQE